MWTAKEKSLSYDQSNEDAARAQKDIKMVNNSLIKKNKKQTNKKKKTATTTKKTSAFKKVLFLE